MAKLGRRNFLSRTLFTGSFLSIAPWAFASQLEGVTIYSKHKSDSENFWKDIRKNFLLHEKRVYFNTAAMGPSAREVVDTIHEKNVEIETKGETLHILLEEATEKVGHFFNVTGNSIVLTRNATEGVNIIANSLPLEKGDEVIITTHEHIGGAAPWIALGQRKGVSVKCVELDLTGKNNFEKLKENVTSKTKAICFSHVTCTTGMVLPAKEIADFCRANNIYSCVDGAQAAGMISVDLKDLNPDFYAFSGHKWLYGPVGTGALYIKPDLITNLIPPFTGAYSIAKFNLKEGEIEYSEKANRMEFGTRNSAHFYAFGTALDFIGKLGGIKVIEERGRYLANRLKQKLVEVEGVELLTPMDEEYSGAIVTFRIKKMDFYDVNKMLDKKRFRVRKIYEADLDAIRISCGINNSMEEIDRLVMEIEEIANNSK